MKPMRLDDARLRWLELARALNTMPLASATKLVEDIRRELLFWPAPAPRTSKSDGR